MREYEGNEIIKRRDEGINEITEEYTTNKLRFKKKRKKSKES